MASRHGEQQLAGVLASEQLEQPGQPGQVVADERRT
jgi:hypothetical protein